MKNVSEDEIFHRAERLAILGKLMEALELVKALIEAGSDQERTWLLYSELSPGLAEKISALEKVAAINPNNATPISRLEKFRETADHPLSAARYLEDCGDTDQGAGALPVNRRPVRITHGTLPGQGMHHPALDRARLRSLIARAREERERGAPPNSFRARR